MVIDVTPEQDVPEAPAASRRYSSAVVAVVAALAGLVAGAAVIGVRQRSVSPNLPNVRINVGVSPYPAPATASWRGADGAVHSIDIWAGEPVTAPAAEVTVAAARLNGGPAQCDLYINGRVVDLATTGPQDQVVTCSWTSTR
jgi:hypothetical protein